MNQNPGGRQRHPGKHRRGGARPSDTINESPAAQMSSPEPTDAELLSRYAQGEPRATRLLAERHTRRAFAVAYRMLRDRQEAEDVTQDVMLRLWRKASDWTADGAALSTWMYRVTTNLCLDRLRKHRESLPGTLPPQADPAPGPLVRITDRERAQALDTALAQLPERQRAAVILRHLEERSNTEIAEALDTSVEAVESLLARGRQRLADILDAATLSQEEGASQ